jgi:hypothetical protein
MTDKIATHVVIVLNKKVLDEYFGPIFEQQNKILTNLIKPRNLFGADAQRNNASPLKGYRICTLELFGGAIYFTRYDRLHGKYLFYLFCLLTIG